MTVFIKEDPFGQLVSSDLETLCQVSKIHPRIPFQGGICVHYAKDISHGV